MLVVLCTICWYFHSIWFLIKQRLILNNAKCELLLLRFNPGNVFTNSRLYNIFEIMCAQRFKCLFLVSIIPIVVDTFYCKFVYSILYKSTSNMKIDCTSYIYNLVKEVNILAKLKNLKLSNLNRF